MILPSTRALAVLFVTWAVTSCGSRLPEGTLVLTQIPRRDANTGLAADILEARYPNGSRVVAVVPGARPRFRVLSAAMRAAGQPAVSPDGGRVLFCGKESEQSTWQIYEVPVSGGRPRRLTSMAGGAMDPAWLPGDRFIFCSPARVKDVGREDTVGTSPAIYAQARASGSPERLSHGFGAVSDLTVLKDGRILFVVTLPSSRGAAGSGLYTVNNDGTELTALAAVHDPASRIQRPRQLDDGRVVFIANLQGSVQRGGVAEQVDLARPFSSRQPLLPKVDSPARSVEPGRDGAMLASLQPAKDGTAVATFGIYELRQGSQGMEVVFDDPDWDETEAVLSERRRPPTGRLSTVDARSERGRMLCLNVNASTVPAFGGASRPASAVRILGRDDAGEPQVIGEAPVHADGSFLIEVPADQALGFETLDDRGQVIRRLPPFVWVRPGENRACIGCHEPHNQCPENTRPIAVKEPAVSIGYSSDIAEVPRLSRREGGSRWPTRGGPP